MPGGTDTVPRDSSDGKYAPLLYLTLALSLLPWAVHTLTTGLNGDAAWYIIAAGRFLSGAAMAESYYDPNPPLSILFYSPAIWLADLTGWHPHYTLCGYIFLLTALWAAATAKVLECFPFLSRLQKSSILAAYLAGGTIMPSICFAEREHIIFMAIFPLTLTQLARTGGLSMPRRLFAVVTLAAAFAVLLKPHYAVLPGLLQLHRAIARRRLSALFDAEFFYFAGIAAVGAVAILALFPDYAGTILPEVLKLYITNRSPEAAMPALFSMGTMIVIFFWIEESFSPLSKDQKNLMLSFYTAALICLIPYAIQMKGFYYHILPALGFFFTGVSMTVLSYIEPYTGRLAPRYAPPLMAVIIIAGAYAYKPLLLDSPSPEDFRTLPLATAIRKECSGNDCSVLFFNDSIEIGAPTIVYNQWEQGSRFSAFWLLPPLENPGPKDPAAGIMRVKLKKMAGEDMKRFKPDILVLADGMKFMPDQPFDFISYFSDDEAFAAAMENYQRREDLVLNRRPYFKGTALDKDDYMTYEIWTRRKE